MSSIGIAKVLVFPIGYKSHTGEVFTKDRLKAFVDSHPNDFIFDEEYGAVSVCLMVGMTQFQAFLFAQPDQSSNNSRFSGESSDG